MARMTRDEVPVTPGPPAGGDELGQLDAAEQGATDAIVESVGATAPPAREALDPRRVTQLGQEVSGAVGALTGGEFELEAPPVQGPIEVVPAEIYAPLTTLATLIDTMLEAGVAAAEPFQFDPDDLVTTNDGLVRGAALMSEMANDQSLADAMRQPVPGGAEPAAPVEEPAAPSVPLEEDTEGLL